MKKLQKAQEVIRKALDKEDYAPPAHASAAKAGLEDLKPRLAKRIAKELEKAGSFEERRLEFLIRTS